MSLPTKNFLKEISLQTDHSKKPTEKQQKIIEAAIKMFAEKGYANTSTSEIAKEAGVAEGTIFRHYRTKDRLLLSILLPFIKKSFPSIAEGVFKEINLDQLTSFEAFLKALITNRIEFIKAHKEIFRILIKEILYNEKLKKELEPFVIKNILSRILPMIERFKEQGELVDLPAETIMRILFTHLFGYFISRFLILPDDIVQDEEAEVEILVNFIMEGLKKRS